ERGRGAGPSGSRGATDQSSFVLLRLSPDQLELRDGLEIAWAPGRALRANELLEAQTETAPAEHFDGHRVLNQVVVGSAANNLTEEIQIARIGGQREVQSCANRRHIKPKRET